MSTEREATFWRLDGTTMRSRVIPSRIKGGKKLLSSHQKELLSYQAVSSELQSYQVVAEGSTKISSSHQRGRGSSFVIICVTCCIAMEQL